MIELFILFRGDLLLLFLLLFEGFEEGCVVGLLILIVFLIVFVIVVVGVIKGVLVVIGLIMIGFVDVEFENIGVWVFDLVGELNLWLLCRLIGFRGSLRVLLFGVGVILIEL